MALVALLAQGTPDQRVQPRRHAVALALQRGRLGVVDLVHQRRLLRGVEGRAAGDQVVQHAGQRVDVGARVEFVAVQLLRRHVGQRADTKDLGALGVQVHHAAEIADLHVHHLVPAQHRQDVGRLDVAVDQPLAGHVGQRHRALEADLHHLLQRQQRIGAAKAAQRHAVHVFHHQVRRFGVLDRVVDLHHVRVLQPPHQRGLGGKEVLLEMAFGRVLRQPGAHALDRHLALVELVPGQEDLARRAFAQARAHRVLADLRRQFGGGTAGGGNEGAGRNSRQGQAFGSTGDGAAPAWRRLRKMPCIATVTRHRTTPGRPSAQK
jgi:hypothetical protein